MEIRASKQRVLSVFSLVMINVIAVDSLRSLPFNATYGLGLITFFVIAAICFFIPTAVVSAELATGWPKTGGLYVWVREAFGKRAGFFTIWLQWIYNVVWYPTILAFLATSLAYLIDPTLGQNKLFLITTLLIAFWGATFANCFGMRVSSWVSILGALVGTILPMLLIIGLGVTWVLQGKPIAMEISVDALFPDFNHINDYAILVGILFGLVGMEMSAVHAEEVKNPQRDYPRALLFSTLIIFSTLLFSSLAIAMVVPVKQLSLVSGLIDAFGIFFEAYHMPWMTQVIAVLIIIGGVSSVSTWVIGPTKGLLAAAKDGDIPALFSQVNTYGAPVTLLILQALLFTVLCSVYIFMPTINSSYWLLSALTAQLALIVYVMMFAAAVKLRYSQPKQPRSYRIPGGQWGMWLVAGIGTLICVGAIILGFFPPSQFETGDAVFYDLFLLMGILILSATPLLIYKNNN